MDSKRIFTHRPVWIPSRFDEVEECRENGDWNLSKEERKEDEEKSRREMRRDFQFFAQRTTLERISLLAKSC